MYLTEILKDIHTEYFINLESPKSLSKIYKINDGQEMQGSQAIGEVIAQTFERAYNLSIEKVIDISNSKAKFGQGPEKYLRIIYKTKVINELAFKYKLHTKNASLEAFDTWEGFLKPSIFYGIVNNAGCLNKLHDFNLNEYIPGWKKKNPDATITSYKYEFYDSEEPDWANPMRLRNVKFEDGHIIIEIDMPVKEVKSVPQETELNDEIL